MDCSEHYSEIEAPEWGHNDKYMRIRELEFHVPRGD